MWSDAGGGGFNTSFGGDDGVGYDTQQFASPGPEAKRGRKIDCVLPLTIQTVLNLDEQNQEYCGSQVNMVRVQGLIREVEVTSTKVTYTLDDTTGTINAIKWIDADTEEEPLMENTYCCVHGTLKTHQGNKQLLALHLEPVTDLNAVVAHLCQVMYTALILKKLHSEASSTGIGKSGPAGMASSSGVMANSMVGFGSFGGPSMGGGDMGMSMDLGLTPQQKMVFEVIRSASSNTEDSGYSREHIKARLKGKVTPQQVDDGLFFLSSEGHIYTTVDDDHFKATDA